MPVRKVKQMPDLNFIDVSLRPGATLLVNATFAVAIKDLALFVESPLAYRLRSVAVTSIRVSNVEQLAVSEVPAALFESTETRLHFSPLCAATDVLTVQFSNSLKAPAAAFRLWVGSRGAISRLVSPLPCAKGSSHAWEVQPSTFTRCNRCALCSAYWVAEGV